MNIFENVKSIEATNAHGEINFLRILDGDVDTSNMTDVTPDAAGYIVGHSESGHHHVLDAPGVEMKTAKDSRGFEILYAIVKNPATLRQAAGDPHESQVIAPGAYIITKNVETDPITKQARIVAD